MICNSQIETARAHGAAPAALPGGAQSFGGRGCGLAGWSFRFGAHRSLQRVGAVALAAVLACTLSPLSADESTGGVAHDGNLTGAFVPVTVPSGQQVLLSEVLLDDTPGALWARFRFVAPQIARAADGIGDAADRAMDFERSAADMDHLCESLALDYLDQHALSPSMVVISFSDRPVEFGTSDAEATQFFEAYRPEGERCIWEAF